MTVDFARLEARMGRAIKARLSNARLVPVGGVAVPVVFSRPVADAAMGQAGMQARDTQATGLRAELGDAVQRGTRCSVYWDDQLVQPAGQYKVRHRDDDLETGMVRLDLELDA